MGIDLQNRKQKIQLGTGQDVPKRAREVNNECRKWANVGGYKKEGEKIEMRIE